MFSRCNDSDQLDYENNWETPDVAKSASNQTRFRKKLEFHAEQLASKEINDKNLDSETFRV